MKSYIYLVVTLGFSFFFFQCSDIPNWGEETHNPTPPGTISNVRVVNTNGGAIIYYTLPSESDLLGVKALYSYSEENKILEKFSSAHTDSIVLVGFPDIKDRKVKLIAVNTSKIESEPVEVTISPLTPPIELIRNSMIVRETFSGVFVSWDNPYKVDIGISLFAEDSTGYMELDYTYYTRSTGNYSFRGFSTDERKFRIEIKDHWNNMATPLDTTLSPLYEEDIVARDINGNATWIRYGYEGDMNGTTLWRGDYPGSYGANPIAGMFAYGPPEGPYFHPGLWSQFYINNYTGNPEHANIEPYPMHFIIDMTRESLLGRSIFYPIKSSTSVHPNGPYHIAVWASNEVPKQPEDFDNDKMASLAYWTTWPEVNGTGAWMDDWDKLGEWKFDAPSGARNMNLWTPDDILWGLSGIDLEFNAEYTNKPYRYLRIVCYESFEGSQLLQFYKWEIFGSVVK